MIKGRLLTEDDIPLENGTALLVDGWPCVSACSGRSGVIKARDSWGRTILVHSRRVEIPFAKPLPEGRIPVGPVWLDQMEAMATSLKHYASLLDDMMHDGGNWQERIDAGDGVDLLNGMDTAVGEAEDIVRCLDAYRKEVDNG